MNKRKLKFFKAVKANDKQQVEDLLKRGQNINAVNRYGHTALHEAAFQGLIKKMIRKELHCTGQHRKGM